MEEAREDIDFSDLGFSEDEIAGLLCGEELGDEYEEAEAEQSGLTKISFTVPSESADQSVSAVKAFLDDTFPDLSIHISATEIKSKTLH